MRPYTVSRWPLLAVTLFALSASATVVIRRSVEELSLLSPLVVRGKVRGVQPRWAEGRRSIHTFIELQVSERLKGEAGDKIQVRVPGGTLDGLTETVAGVATYREGEDVLLFLEHPGDDSQLWITRGMALGKVSFRPDAKGQLRALRDLRGLATYEPASTQPVQELPEREDLGSAEALLARVRQALGSKEAR